MTTRVRELALAALVGVMLLALSPWAHGANVATLEVETKSGTLHQKLDRIEGKIDTLLARQPAAPPALPPVLPPAPPPDQPPAPPAGPNPFIEWCAQGNNIPQFIMVRNGGAGLTPAQIEQARAAGCFGAPPAPPGPTTPGTGVDPNGFDLGDGGGTVLRHVVFSGQALTITFTRRGTGTAQIRVAGSPGEFFRRLADAVDGGPLPAMSSADGSGSYFYDATALPEGRHTYTVVVDGSGTLGIQLNQP